MGKLIHGHGSCVVDLTFHWPFQVGAGLHLPRQAEPSPVSLYITFREKSLSLFLYCFNFGGLPCLCLGHPNSSYRDVGLINCRVDVNLLIKTPPPQSVCLSVSLSYTHTHTLQEFHSLKSYHTLISMRCTNLNSVLINPWSL